MKSLTISSRVNSVASSVAETTDAQLLTGPHQATGKPTDKVHPCDSCDRVMPISDKVSAFVWVDFFRPKWAAENNNMPKMNRPIRLRLDGPTRRQMEKVIPHLLHPTTTAHDAIHFIVDLALANMHLLSGHINSANRFARRNNISLREVLSSQVALQSTRPLRVIRPDKP